MRRAASRVLHDPVTAADFDYDRVSRCSRPPTSSGPPGRHQRPGTGYRLPSSLATSSRTRQAGTRLPRSDRERRLLERGAIYESIDVTTRGDRSGWGRRLLVGCLVAWLTPPAMLRSRTDPSDSCPGRAQRPPVHGSARLSAPRATAYRLTCRLWSSTV